MNEAKDAIRPLTFADVARYRTLRLAALAESPESFGSSVEDEKDASDAFMAERAVPAAPGVTFGAFDDGDLIGIASYAASQKVKTRHKGTMVGVYIAPSHRGTGLGRRLVERVVEHAATLGVILNCTVTSHNAAALRLYRDLGFRTYGLEKAALYVNGVFLDEELLSLDLRENR